MERAVGLPEKTIAGPVSGRVLLVAPVPPPYGGMALQAALLQKLLRGDGVSADLLGHNRPFSGKLRFLGSVPILRTLARTGIFCLRFWRQVRNNDVVHVLAASRLHFFLVVCPAILMGRLRGKQVILNYRAGNADEFLKRYRWFAKPFFQMADITTTPSKFLAQVIQERIGVPVSIVPNIVNFSLFRYRERRQFLPKILVTRHLEEDYDVESVLRAFRQVQKNYPGASLWIAGTGSQEGRLRELVRRWNLTNVRFLGYVDHRSLPTLYDQCDILLNASRVDNFPASLLEASAAGLVVVSTTAGGIPFMYENGKNALLTDVGDWDGLATEVERVLRHQDLARRLASAGMELCQQYCWRNVRRILYAVYRFPLPGEPRETSSPDPRCVWTTEQ